MRILLPDQSTRIGPRVDVDILELSSHFHDGRSVYSSLKENTKIDPSASAVLIFLQRPSYFMIKRTIKHQTKTLGGWMYNLCSPLKSFKIKLRTGDIINN